MATNFFELKSIVQSVLLRLGLDNLKSEPTSSPLFSEGLTFTYKKNSLVSFGLVKKSILKHFDIKQDVLFADFDWGSILKQINTTPVKYKEIPKHPEVKGILPFYLIKKLHIVNCMNLLSVQKENI